MRAARINARDIDQIENDARFRPAEACRLRFSLVFLTTTPLVELTARWYSNNLRW
jgi:hypothetical protein